MRYLLIVAAFAIALPLHAAMYETSVPPKEGEKYKSADFKIWVPDDVKFIRGIVIRQHGCGRNGFDHAEDVQWQALARKHDCALLGSWYQPVKECSDWFDPKGGSERALLDALKTFADKSKHPEIADAPWAVWGHSGGALWAMHLTFRHPERMIAAIPRSQAVGGENLKALQVPVLITYGEQEKTGRFEKVHVNSQEVFGKFRPQGALWSLAIDPKSSHDCRNSRQISIPFFDACLTQRLPKEKGPLLPMDTKKAWLGNPETFEVAAIADYRGDRNKACWLPDETVARKWQEFVKTGAIEDKSPPEPPTNVKAAVTSAGVRLTWSAIADLETGIKLFHIYRDGARIGSVGGEMGKANPQGFYQVWNYGDEPEPKAAPMTYIDKDGKAGAKYHIGVENFANMQTKSAEAIAK